MIDFIVRPVRLGSVRLRLEMMPTVNVRSSPNGKGEGGMILKTLTIQGFGSFVQETEFTFPRSGFHFMSGVNQVNPQVGANAGAAQAFTERNGPRVVS